MNFDWIFNPILIMLMAFPFLALFFMWLGSYFSQPMKNRVQQIDVANGRGKDYEARFEDDVEVRCNGLGDEEPVHFYKTGQPTNMTRKGFLGRLYSYGLYLGRIGSGYTYNLDDKPDKKIPLTQGLKTMLGELWEELSEEVKQKIAEAKIGMIVEFPKVTMTPLNPHYNPEEPESKDNPRYMPPVGSADLRRGALDTLINSLAKGIAQMMSKSTGGQIVLMALGIGTGSGLTLLLLLAFGKLNP